MESTASACAPPAWVAFTGKLMLVDYVSRTKFAAGCLFRRDDLEVVRFHPRLQVEQYLFHQLDGQEALLRSQRGMRDDR